MTEERAGLATLRAQLGYAETAVADKAGRVANRAYELEKAEAELAEAQQRRKDYLDAINLLERSGYSETEGLD